MSQEGLLRRLGTGGGVDVIGRCARRWRHVLRNRDGATALEYGLIAGGISVAIIVVIFAIGGHVEDMMVRVGDMIGSNL